MPQLNPSPWFGILMFSWFMLLVYLPPKIVAHFAPNPPTAKIAQKTDNPFWTWPWL